MVNPDQLNQLYRQGNQEISLFTQLLNFYNTEMLKAQVEIDALKKKVSELQPNLDKKKESK